MKQEKSRWLGAHARPAGISTATGDGAGDGASCLADGSDGSNLKDPSEAAAYPAARRGVPKPSRPPHNHPPWPVVKSVCRLSRLPSSNQLPKLPFPKPHPDDPRARRIQSGQDYPRQSTRATRDYSRAPSPDPHPCSSSSEIHSLLCHTVLSMACGDRSLAPLATACSLALPVLASAPSVTDYPPSVRPWVSIRDRQCNAQCHHTCQNHPIMLFLACPPFRERQSTARRRRHLGLGLCSRFRARPSLL